MADAEAAESWPGEDCLMLLEKLRQAGWGLPGQEWVRVDVQMALDESGNIVHSRDSILSAQSFINSRDWPQSRISRILLDPTRGLSGKRKQIKEYITRDRSFMKRGFWWKPANLETDVSPEQCYKGQPSHDSLWSPRRISERRRLKRKTLFSPQSSSKRTPRIIRLQSS